MTWLAWRQFRFQAMIAAMALAALGVVVIATGPGLAHLYDSSVGACHPGTDCSAVVARFLGNDGALQFALRVAMVVVPGLIGVFWGAPLVAREIETGTFRLAWTQSVSRTRWLLVKLLLGGLAAMVAAGLLSLAVTWWFSPFDRASMTQFDVFDQRGIVPIGYAAFGFVAGVVTGIVVRRTVAAMAVTLVVLVLLRVGVAEIVRPHTFTPVKQDRALTTDPGIGYGVFSAPGASGQPTIIPGPAGIPNAWVYAVDIVDSRGTSLSPDVVARECPELSMGGPAAGSGGGGAHAQAAGGPLGDCAARLAATYHERLTFQPANRFWPLQWTELGIFLALTAVGGGAGLWWIRRRGV